MTSFRMFVRQTYVVCWQSAHQPASQPASQPATPPISCTRLPAFAMSGGRGCWLQGGAGRPAQSIPLPCCRLFGHLLPPVWTCPIQRLHASTMATDWPARQQCRQAWRQRFRARRRAEVSERKLIGSKSWPFGQQADLLQVKSWALAGGSRGVCLI